MHFVLCLVWKGKKFSEWIFFHIVHMPWSGLYVLQLYCEPIVIGGECVVLSVLVLF